MWKLRVQFEEIDYTHEFEDLSKQRESLNDNWIEDYVNEELIYVMVDVLDIYDRVDKQHWLNFDYTVTDSNGEYVKY